MHGNYHFAPPEPTAYFLVVVAEGEPASVSQFDTKQELAEYLRDDFKPEDGARVQLFIFRGTRLNITAGPQKFLLDGGQTPVPLFHQPNPQAPPVYTGDWFDDPDADDVAGPAKIPFKSSPSQAGLGDDPDP